MWGSYNGRIVHPTGRRCYARFQGREEFRGTGYRPPIVWGQGIQIRPTKNPPQPFDSSSRPAAALPISPASVSEAISKLQREKDRIQRDLDQKKAEYEALGPRMKELDKVMHDLRDARVETDDAQRGAITMFNEQKRYELNIQRLQSDVHRANTSMEKMRTEAVGLRMKIEE